MTLRRLIVGVFFSALSASVQTFAAPVTLPGLLSQFRTETDRALKEKILNQITSQFPGAGPELLALAEGPENGDTNWLAIKGVGYLKFSPAVPFLEKSLNSRSAFVRANAARSLGEIGDASAIDPLITALTKEENSGVIEQTSLAFEMLHAKKAIPVLKTKIGNPSHQTRVWILGAVELLGGRTELPFIAASLQDPNIMVRYGAALMVERLTGQDFGFPECAKRGNGLCGFDDAPVANARHWWSDHAQEWNK